MEIKNIAVFCGSSTGINSVYIECAKNFGKELAINNKTLIYGGAQVGCMGALADASLSYEGNVIGVIPEKLKAVEIAHNGVVCGRGRNPTLRLWPAIFSGEIDVFPSERRNMGQEIGR